MIPLSALSGMRPFIATPMYQGGVPGYSTSMFALGGFFGKLGVDAQLRTVSQSIVTEARNALVMLFLQGDATHFFFWDADVHANVDECIRLLLADKDVVSGVCPLKTTPSDLQYPFKLIDDTLRVDEDGFGEVDWCTTGFMCIKRGVFERMIRECHELDYEPDRIAGDLEQELKTRRWYGFFHTMLLPSRKFIPEDYAFSHRWRSIGGQIWIDTRSKLNHEGNYVFKGDFGKHLHEKASPSRIGVIL